MRKKVYYDKHLLWEKSSLIESKFKDFIYEKAVLLWKRKFYYKNQKIQLWEGSSFLEKEFYCEKESLLWK